MMTIGTQNQHSDLSYYLVYVWMYQGNIVIACYAVAQGRQALIYSLYNNLLRKAVSAVLQFCMQH